MRGLVLLVGFLATLPAAHADVGANVLTEGVTPIKRSGEPTDPALLLVFVVDQDGAPLEGVDVSLLFAKGSKGTGRTAKDGTALMRSERVGRLIVRAFMARYVPAEAHNVLLRSNGLTVVALALAAE